MDIILKIMGYLAKFALKCPYSTSYDLMVASEWF